MMKFIRMLAAAAVLSLLAACAYPTTRTDIPDERPSLAFTGAPNGSSVWIDNLRMGSATEFNGKDRVLTVEPGNHLVEVRFGDRIILSRRVFLSGPATRTFTVQ